MNFLLLFRSPRAKTRERYTRGNSTSMTALAVCHQNRY
jgi:hypothetical protein